MLFGPNDGAGGGEGELRAWLALWGWALNLAGGAEVWEGGRGCESHQLTGAVMCVAMLSRLPGNPLSGTWQTGK